MVEDSKKKYLLYGGIAVALLALSMIIYFVVGAATGDNEIKVNRAKITSIKTGTADFDSSDSTSGGVIDNYSIEGYIAGNDASEYNRLVRSFDTVTYDFDFSIAAKTGNQDYSERTVNINVELTPEEAKYITFEADGVPGETNHTYSFDGIDTYGPMQKSITLYVLGAPNGMNVNPKIIIKESTDEDAGTSLGKISSDTNYYEYENDTYKSQANFENYLPIVVSSKKANLRFDTLTVDESQRTTLDGTSGRYITFVSGLYLDGDSSKGIKGYDMPTGDISFNTTISQNGTNPVVTKDEWARFYSSVNIGELESISVAMPYSTADSFRPQKEVSYPGGLTTTRNDNGYSNVVKDYKTIYSFPNMNADDSATGNKYYIGTYAFTVFSPRTSSDGKNDITVTYNLSSASANSTNGEAYQINDNVANATNQYYQSSDHSYESGFYTEDDQKINTDSNIGSLSKGTNFIYKTTFNYKKSSSEEGIKEVIKVNPNAFRVVNYSDRGDIVDIDIKCGDSECSNISKDDFDIKLVSGDYNNSNYSITEVSERVNEEDRASYTTACNNLNTENYNSDQILNLYGGPCIKANDGVEDIYSKLSDAVTSDGGEVKITKVIVQTKEGTYLPDNATVTVKTKLRVRNVADLTRLYQVASTISSSDYDTVLHYYYPNSDSVIDPDNYSLPTIYGSNVINVNPVSYADSIRIAAFTSRQELSIENKNNDGTMKTTYNAVDNETIVFNVKPYIEDNGQNSGLDDSWFTNNVVVTVTLPSNLTYISDSDQSKYLVGEYTIGDITYLNFALPFSKPNSVMDTIVFKAKINSKIKGSAVPIEVTSRMYATNVNDEINSSLFGESVEKLTLYGNGTDNIIVEQKVGNNGTLVEKNAEFSYLLYAYNNTSDRVEDYSILDILPSNKDGNGTKFSGEYEVKLNVPASVGTAKIYCSTQSYEDLDNEVNSTKNEWTECPEIAGSYKSVTAIKISNITIESDSYIEPIEVIIKPTNNNYSDTYVNRFIGAKEGYSKNTSNSISVAVVSRSISGKVFNDVNENGVQDDKDSYVSGIPVTLYKINNEEETMISETVTDKDGKYIFKDLDVGKYYIDLNYDGNKYDLTRRYASIDENVDSDAYKVSGSVARISNKRVPDDPFGIRVTRENINLENYDMGLIPRRMFGFDLKKYITRIDLTYNGTSDTTNYNNESRVTISVRNSLRATAKVYYGIAIINDSNRPGYVKEIEESIPDGLIFDQSLEENKDWVLVNGKVISTALADTVIYPGETKYLQIALLMPTRETAGAFLNTVSIVDMLEYEEPELPADGEYVNSHGYSIGEAVDFAGISWHVTDTENMDDGSQKVTLFADSGSISENMAHSSFDKVYKWSESEINTYINHLWNNSLDKSALYDISICDDGSGLEVASYGGSISGTCQSNIFTSSKIRLLSSEEYTRIKSSTLSNIDWLTGNGDYWLQSSDDTRPVYNIFGTEPSDSYGDISSSSYNKASYVSSTGIKSALATTAKEVRPVITISSNNILFE